MHRLSRMPALAVVAAGLCALVACAQSHGSTERRAVDGEVSATRAELSRDLLDPASAQFRDVAAYRMSVNGASAYVFCGEVNAKNAYGGYTGFRQFVASPKMHYTQDDAGFANLWSAMCNEDDVSDRKGDHAKVYRVADVKF